MKHSMNDIFEAGLKICWYLVLAIFPVIGIYGLIQIALYDITDMWFSTFFLALITGFALVLGVIAGAIYGLGYLQLHYGHRVKMAVGKRLAQLGKEKKE